MLGSAVAHTGPPGSARDGRPDPRTRLKRRRLRRHPRHKHRRRRQDHKQPLPQSEYKLYQAGQRPHWHQGAETKDITVKTRQWLADEPEGRGWAGSLEQQDQGRRSARASDTEPGDAEPASSQRNLQEIAAENCSSRRLWRSARAQQLCCEE